MTDDNSGSFLEQIVPFWINLSARQVGGATTWKLWEIVKWVTSRAFHFVLTFALMGGAGVFIAILDRVSENNNCAEKSDSKAARSDFYYFGHFYRNGLNSPIFPNISTAGNNKIRSWELWIPNF